MASLKRQGTYKHKESCKYCDSIHEGNGDADAIASFFVSTGQNTWQGAVTNVGTDAIKAFYTDIFSQYEYTDFSPSVNKSSCSGKLATVLATAEYKMCGEFMRTAHIWQMVNEGDAFKITTYMWNWALCYDGETCPSAAYPAPCKDAALSQKATFSKNSVALSAEMKSFYKQLPAPCAGIQIEFLCVIFNGDSEDFLNEICLLLLCFCSCFALQKGECRRKVI